MSAGKILVVDDDPQIRRVLKIMLTGQGLTIRVAATVNGYAASLPSSHTITVQQGGHLHVSVDGFKAGTTASVWGFSNPVILTRLSIDASQVAAQDFALPASMQPGNHTLVVSGTSSDGKGPRGPGIGRR